MFSFSVQILSETFLILRSTERNMTIHLHKSSFKVGIRWRSWLRHCATSQKVAASIPDGVIGFFRWRNPSGCTMVGFDSASNRNEYQECFLEVKAAGAYGWQPYHLHVHIVLKYGRLKLLKPSGPVQACNGIALFLRLPIPSFKLPVRFVKFKVN
jgi:hypothetical protein